MDERIKNGMVVRHFKGKYYLVLNTEVYHSETKERMVLYMALTTNALYVRPYDMFMSLVDRTKYPTVHQKYRFERELMYAAS